MTRSLSRERQKIWFSKVDERQSGIDTVPFYSKPVMKKLAVSTSAGTPEEIAAGIVPDYDRYIVYHKNRYCSNEFELEEGMVCWIDVIPQFDDSGNLIMDEDEITPVTPPDYVIKKILGSQKSIVSRYGISKIGGSE